jgi:hypothetical protein
MTRNMVEHSKNNGTLSATTEKVADVLEREMDFVIHDWREMVEKQEDLMIVPLNFEERIGYLPQLLRDLIARLRSHVGTKAPISIAASQHGELRRRQGYTVAMVVEESRLLEVCLFTTLHKGVSHLNFTKLLPDVVAIADEADAQLKQQVLCYMVANAI